MSPEVQIECPKDHFVWSASPYEWSQVAPINRLGGEWCRVRCPKDQTYVVFELKGPPGSQTAANPRLETTEEENLRKWFEAQQLDSIKNIEAGATALTGLNTGLLGLLFTVVAITGDLPSYVSKVGGMAIAAVTFWLVSLVAALGVLIPGRWMLSLGKPNAQKTLFENMRSRKEGWMLAAAIFFGLGVLMLWLALVTALMTVTAPPAG